MFERERCKNTRYAIFSDRIASRRNRINPKLHICGGATTTSYLTESGDDLRNAVRFSCQMPFAGEVRPQTNPWPIPDDYLRLSRCMLSPGFSL